MKKLFESSELHEAVMEGDAEQVRRLLEAGADVNARDFFEYTPLMQSCTVDKASLNKFLQERKASKAKEGGEADVAPFDLKNLPRIDSKQMLAEMDRKREYDDAPVEDDTTIVEVLLQFGADINAVDKGGHSALAKAVMAGRVETARLLLEQGADIRTTDTSDFTPLMLAAKERRLETVRLLLGWGADADYRTPQGGTTLMAAAEGGRVEIAAALIAQGQDVNTVNGNGITALQRAATRQHEEMIAFLKEQGAQVGFLEAVLLGDYAQAQAAPVPEPAARGAHWGQLALAWTTRRGSGDLIRLLLEHGINPNAVFGKGSILMQAVMRGNVACARLLLEAGAEANGAPGQRFSPLSWAGQQGDTEMMNLLLAHGADVNVVKPEGASTLGSAVMFGHVEAARKLLEAGADPNAKTMRDNISLLAFATARDNKEMIRLLLDFGADPKGEDASNAMQMAKNKPEIAAMLKQAAGTDLHELAKEGKTAEVLARLEAGADIDARNELDRTPLMIALQGKQSATAQALIARGADIHTVNRYQQTALHFAISVGDADIVRLLIAQGAEVMASDAVGKSPLHFAALYGKTEIVTLLIEAGARVGTVEAALLGDLPTLRSLLDSGADVNAPDGGGMTPLMAAAAGGHEELIAMLLTRHADKNATSEDGKTALALAVGYRRLNAVRLLLENGAEVNRAGVDQGVVRFLQKRFQGASEDVRSHFEGWEQTPGRTPLACAAVLGDVECARLLVTHGADVSAKSGFPGRTVLAGAVLMDKVEMARFLLDNGADPRTTEQNEGNLLQMAQKMGKSAEMIALLREVMKSKL